MKNGFRVVLLLAIGLISSSDLFCQGTFKDLDFESAILVPIPGNSDGAVVWSNALPGWTGYIGGQIQTSVIPNGVPVGYHIPFIALTVAPLASPLQGQYGIEIGEGEDYSGNIIPVSLEQTGFIPIGTKSLQFLSEIGPPDVFIDGQQLSIVQLGNGPYTWSALYGADISAFQGSTETLSFTVGGYFDDIQFSSTAVPEPAPFKIGVFCTILVALQKSLSRKCFFHFRAGPGMTEKKLA